MRSLRPRTILGRAVLFLGGLSVLLDGLRWIAGSASGSKLSGWAAFVTGVFAFCAWLLAFGWARRTLHPKTKLGRITLWFGGLSVLLIALRIGSSQGSTLSGWATFATIVFTLGAFWLSFRWAWRHLLWRLRYRLIVTYIFIGVIPVVLLLVMAGVGGYLFAGQFATYIVISNMQSALQHLDAANAGLAKQFSALERSGKLNEQIAGELIAVSDENFPQRTVTVWRGEKGLVFPTASARAGPPGPPRTREDFAGLPSTNQSSVAQASSSPARAGPARPSKMPETREGSAEPPSTNRSSVALASSLKPPDTTKGNFGGFVLDGDSLHLRAVKHDDAGGSRITVLSDVRVTPELLQSAASLLGSVTLLLPDSNSDVQIPPPADVNPIVREHVVAGGVPPSSNRLDRTILYYTLFSTVDWKTGESQDSAIEVVTRPSMLYSALFATLGNKATILRYTLLGIAIFFGLIELAALFIGVRLSRGMTLSVAELYSATEHVESGDLTHRIPIRGSDQMSVLEQSFNSMTESLAKLLTEQKEKQRLENELAIGHEVQDSLFPHKFTGLASLEVYGVCRPARSVSGDYYDFIPLGPDRVVLAVGDISGKGISAALLMATVHAFVRAYSLEPGDPAMYYRGDGATQSQLDPGMLMATLNYQLFRSTPPEKYATMFLACYDAAARELKYCNAGHLSPMMLRGDDTLSRLETSGTVVGLFDHADYGESSIAMHPGDIFVAFSDGVTEPENQGVEFGEERLIELVRKHRGQPLSSIGDAITGSVADWIGGVEQPDDVTVVLARAL